MKRPIALGLAMLAFGSVSTAAVNGLDAREITRAAYDTPIWKTIALGTYRSVNALRNALDSERCGTANVSVEAAKEASPAVPTYNEGPTPPSFCHVEVLADEIIGRPAFALSRVKTEVDLVVLSVFQLGFGQQGASYKDIYARAEALGFALCPPEVGPLLRLQYLEQPLGEVLHIAMQPIKKYHDGFVALNIENGSWGLLVSGHYVSDVDVMYSRALFVFVKPRYGDSWN